MQLVVIKDLNHLFLRIIGCMYVMYECVYAHLHVCVNFLYVNVRIILAGRLATNQITSVSKESFIYRMYVITC